MVKIFARYTFLMTLGLSLTLGACSKKPKEEGDAAADMAAQDLAGGAFAPGAAIPELPAVYFEYDSFNLTAASKTQLDAHAQWMKSNSVRVQVEGHCDERGTTEYNLALGERRAAVIKDYLVGRGVPTDRVSTISYGEERPSVQGADESAWGKNRRGEFVSMGQ